MKIIKAMDADRAVLVLSGRLDSGTAPKLLEALMAEIENSNEIVLDFADVAYVSSAGLKVLLQGHKAAIAKDGVMTLRNIGPDVMEVLDVTGFAMVLNIE